MKKIFFALTTLAMLTAYGATLDLTQAKATWTAFKTSEKVPVSGSFGDIKYKFGKGKDTIAQALEGATATINALSVDLGDETKNANVKEYFFAKFPKKDIIKVTFKNVIEANNKGSILATINMNGKSVKVPMQFEIKEGMFEATGVIDIMQFGLMDAFKSLATFCHDLHEGLTWTQVEVSFSAPVK